MTQIFLSHSTKDAEFAEKLASDLRSAGIPVWKAPESILPGEAWVAAIQRGLSTSTHLVLLMSPAAVESKWVNVEFETAFDLNVQGQMSIIPLDYMACSPPPFWKRFQAIPKFSDNYATRLSTLKNRLQTDHPTQPPEPTDPASTLHVGVHGIASYTDQPEAPSKIVLEESSDSLAAPQAPGLPVEPEMILIPAGPFLIGSSKSEDLRNDNEPEQFELNIDYDYAIGKYPVTVGQYRAFIDARGYGNDACWTEAGRHWRDSTKRTQPDFWTKEQWTGEDNLPVIGVSWYEAYAYTCWLAEATGRDYRLLTEAEWEKAARGGLQIPDGRSGMKKNPNPARIWPWGDDQPTAELCNFYNNYQGGRTSPVTSHAAHAKSQPYSLHHMAGNVWEWCLSKGADPFIHPNDNDPEGDGLRVARGGSWANGVRLIRCSFRYRLNPLSLGRTRGFRVGGVIPVLP